MGDDRFNVQISKVKACGGVFAQTDANITASEDGKALVIVYSKGRPTQEEIPMSCFTAVGQMPTATSAKAMHIDCVKGNTYGLEALKVECNNNENLRKVREFFVKHLGEKTKKKKIGTMSHLSKITKVASPSSKAKERENYRPGSRVGQAPFSSAPISGSLSSRVPPPVPKRQHRMHMLSNQNTPTGTSDPLHIENASDSQKTRKRPMSESTGHITEILDAPTLMFTDWKKSKTSFDQRESFVQYEPYEAPAADMDNSDAIMALTELGLQTLVNDEIQETDEHFPPFSYRAMSNLGNSCYMNASLQALASSPNFIRKLLTAVPTPEEQKEFAIPKRTDVLNAVANVYRHMFSCRDNLPERGKKKSVVYVGNQGQIPKTLLRNVRITAGSCLDEEFATSSQQDAHEFVSTLLDLMKDDIGPKEKRDKESTESPSSSTASDKENGPGDETTRPKQEKNPDKISDDFLELSIFDGKMNADLHVRSKNPSEEFKINCIATIGCLRCGWSTKKVDTALDLQVGIKDGDVSIRTLIESQLEREEIEYKCESCGTMGPAFMSTAFQQLPETLIVVVKRYQYTPYAEATKFEKNVTVDRELFLKDLCEGSEAKKRESAARGLSRNEGTISGDMPKLSDSGAKTQISPTKNVIGIPGSPKKGLITTTPRKGRRLSMSHLPGDIFETQRSNVCDSQELNHMNPIDEEVSFEIDDEGHLGRSTTPLPTQEERPASPECETKDDTVVPQTGGGEASGNNEVDLPASIASETHHSLAYEGDSHQEQVVTPKASDSGDSVTIIKDPNGDKPHSVKWKPLTAKHAVRIQELLELEEYNEDEIESWRKTHLCTASYDAYSNDDPAIIKADADGNCLFRCVSWYILKGNQMHHDIIRARVCNFIDVFGDHFVPLISRELSIEEHVKSMEIDGAWGTEVELAAMATFFKCCIFSHFQGKWTLFKPLFNFKHCVVDGYTFEDRNVNVDKVFEERGAIYISNRNNIHFDIVCAPDVTLTPDDVHDMVDNQLMAVQNMDDLDADLETAKPSTPNLFEFESNYYNNDNNFYNEEPILPKDTYVYKEDDEPVYTLTAVVNHSGNSLRYGHYTSYAFDSERNVWLNCNDSVISKVDETEVLRDSSSTGYMFIYRRRHLNDTTEFKQSFFPFQR